MKTTGFLPSPLIKAITFGVVSACIVLATAAGILLAWGSIAEALANRLFWTAGILAFGSIIFLLNNYLFGLPEYAVRPSNTELMPTDPAFAERLAKAKGLRQGGDEESKVG